MQFFIPYRNSGSTWVYNLRAIAHNYLHNTFVLFLIAAVPIDLLLVIGNVDERFGFLRAVRLMKPIVSFISGSSSPLRRFLSRLDIDLSLLELIKFGVITLVTAHWLACIWAFVGINYSDNQPINLDLW